MNRKKKTLIVIIAWIGILLFQLKITANATNGIVISENNYVTPEMFGAVGDGVSDDTYAISKAIKTGLPVMISNTYVMRTRIFVDNNCYLFGKGTILVQNKEATVFQMTTSALDYFVVKDIHFILTEGISLERQQNLFYSGIVNLSLMQLENITVDMYGENGYVVTHSTNVFHYVIDGIKVNNMSTNSLGGCIWVNSEVDTTVDISNCEFTQIPKDEILSIYCGENHTNVTINCNVDGCTFVRLENPNVSRGFSIRGWRGTNNYMKFTNCSFVIANDDNMLTMSGKGTLVEMENCTIVGNPSGCVFGGYETHEKEEYSYVINNCEINTQSCVAGNYEHWTKMASPNICFKNCDIKGKVLFNIKNDSNKYIYVLSTVESCNIEVENLMRTQGTSTGIITVNNSELNISQTMMILNSAEKRMLQYPILQETILKNNIINNIYYESY